MKTNREIVMNWRGYTLTIPAGTPAQLVKGGMGGGDWPAVAASAEFLQPPMKAVCASPQSMFAHDAKHYWVWIEPKDVEPSP